MDKDETWVLSETTVAFSCTVSESNSLGAGGGGGEGDGEGVGVGAAFLLEARVAPLPPPLGFLPGGIFTAWPFE